MKSYSFKEDMNYFLRVQAVLSKIIDKKKISFKYLEYFYVFIPLSTSSLPRQSPLDSAEV